MNEDFRFRIARRKIRQVLDNKILNREVANGMENIVRDIVARSRNVGRQRRWITAEWAKYICLGNTLTRTHFCEGQKSRTRYSTWPCRGTSMARRKKLYGGLRNWNRFGGSVASMAASSPPRPPPSMPDDLPLIEINVGCEFLKVNEEARRRWDNRDDDYLIQRSAL